MNVWEAMVLLACGLPLAAALANGVNALVGDRLYSRVSVARISVTAVAGAFAASVFLAISVILEPGAREITIYRFLRSGEFVVDFGFLIDPLSVLMMLVVTGVGALVTRFSVNYMHNEVGFTRYFTVVSLFLFAMLVLVLADSYLVMFLGWEGVGVCSYLLISFYRDRPASARAGTKAFLMNRVGDAGILLAMFLLVAHTGSLRYADVFVQAPSLSGGLVTAVGLLLLLGATGKSAQLPLGTWLAQAMEGPTPSSALIHAATMVTAGVYLVVRSAPLYDQAPNALIAVGVVGVLTALYGQLVGYVQTDIKGVLAASTTAQLGLMFLFCGLGLYAVAIFHLVAHAFYKSYLFLTAPSILHHLHGGPDPAAVRRPTDTAPLVATAFLVTAGGLLSLPLVGRVLSPSVELTGNIWVVAALGLIAVFAVLFSAWRMTGVGPAHHGVDRRHAHDTAHTVSPDPAHGTGRVGARLVAPVFVVAALVAIGLGVDVLPAGLEGSWFHRLLDGTAAGSVAVPPGHPLLVTFLVGVLGLLALSGWYGPRYLDRFREEFPPPTGSAIARRLYWWSLNRGYLDDIYRRVVVAPTVRLGKTLERFDGAVLERAAHPAGGGPAAPPTWESRFSTLKGNETAEILDWLPSPTATTPDGRSRRFGARASAAARRTQAWSRRSADAGGVFGGTADAGARLAEGVEQRVFQTLDTTTLRLAGIISAVIDGIERRVFQTVDTTTLRLAGVISAVIEGVEDALFQSGLDRRLAKAGNSVQRLLLATERRLGEPLVIGTILILTLLALGVGVR